MPCHAMHPIQYLFLESFSYVLQFDMHFYMHSYVDKKKFILVKSGCYSCGPYISRGPCRQPFASPHKGKKGPYTRGNS
jgi:hypothetical protein